MIIAIDGPLASGKGTLARALAAHYGLPHLDTGALYRATALQLINKNIEPSNESEAIKAANALDLSLFENPELRSAKTGAGASVVAAFPEVRKALYDFQVNFANQEGGAVLDGRDIGTVICPNADFKFFVVADANERAERRHRELLEKGEEIALETLITQIKERDERDSNRNDAPLTMAKDAHLLDTSGLSIERVIEKACAIIDANR
ncbi:MAG: cytidylate kinase [Hyphomonadaceae bacterium]|nr:MAG: cytidylate kinase [Hyphomonadaceae bacterium]